MSTSHSGSPSLLEENPVEEEQDASEVRQNGPPDNGDHEENGKRLSARRKKLADGFYEVEAIRKKRICKGEAQYLIKWHGWPESANTWEPVSNLHTCHDVVEAYEQSLSSGQRRSSRKRKRLFTREKKKMQPSYGGNTAKRIPVKMTLKNEAQDSETLNDSSNLNAGEEVPVEHIEGIERSKVPTEIVCNGSETVAPHVDSGEQTHGHELSTQNTITRTSDVHIQQLMPVEGDSQANCHSKVNGEEDDLRNQRRGAKRRKSGSVRRFTMEATLVQGADSGNTVLQSSCDRVEPMSKPDGHNQKKTGSPRNPVFITRLIKPISYSTSVRNNIQDVSVTFAAMRSDGQEVMVDNRFLRANNPNLLIDFYEQHLRYNPN